MDPLKLLWDLLLRYYVTFLETRWRVRSFAELWIRRARPCACAWRTESHTLIRRRSAERRARWRAVQLRPQPILPSIFLLQTRLSSKLLAT